MKSKVLIAFYDKKAKVLRKPGSTFDATPARFNEITRKGRYIEACGEVAEKAEKAEKAATNLK